MITKKDAQEALNRSLSGLQSNPYIVQKIITGTKEKAYNSLTEKMNIYSLNSTINSNIEECFEEIKKSMKTLINAALLLTL